MNDERGTMNAPTRLYFGLGSDCLGLFAGHDGVGEDHAIAEHEQNRRERQTQEALGRRDRKTNIAADQQQQRDGKGEIVLPRERILKTGKLGRRLASLSPLA